jgi:hypothetical protein
MWVGGRAVWIVSLDSCVHAVLIHAVAWSSEHRAFVVEEFIQNGGSLIMTQRSQQTKFPILVSQ